MAIIGVSNGIILEVPDKGQTEWADIMTLVFQIISAHNHDGNGHGAKLGSASLDDLSITTAKIVNLAVTTAKLADLSVSTAKLADLAVTSGKLADDSVTTAKVLNANITSAKLATDAALDNISSGSILADKLATDSVTTTKIVDANVTTAKLANVAVTDAKLAALSALKLTPLSADPGSPVTGQLQYADGTARTAGLWAWNGSAWVSFSGAVTDDSVYTDAIQDNAVTNAKMADNSVNTAELVANAVTGAKIADGTINRDKLQDTAFFLSATVIPVTTSSYDFSYSDVYGSAVILYITHAGNVTISYVGTSLIPGNNTPVYIINKSGSTRTYTVEGITTLTLSSFANNSCRMVMQIESISPYIYELVAFPAQTITFGV